jgi:rubrerythrin
VGKEPLYPHVPKSRKRDNPVLSQFLDDLQKAVNEEADASLMYLRMARTADALGLETWATTLAQIANDENRHHIRLEEMLEEGRKGPDLRKDYDEKAEVLGGTLYRKGNIVQVWWSDGTKETWTSDVANAQKNFQSMKERWS